MNTQPLDPAGGAAAAAQRVGYAALLVLLVPPGLLLSPLCGAAAIALGVRGLGEGGDDARARERAYVGIALGAAALAASIALIWLLHPLIGRVLDDIRYG